MWEAPDRKERKRRGGSGANFLQEIAKRDPPKTHLAARPAAAAPRTPNGKEGGGRDRWRDAAGFFVLYRYRGSHRVRHAITPPKMSYTCNIEERLKNTSGSSHQADSTARRQPTPGSPYAEGDELERFSLISTPNSWRWWQVSNSLISTQPCRDWALKQRRGSTEFGSSSRKVSILPQKESAKGRNNGQFAN